MDGGTTGRFQRFLLPAKLLMIGGRAAVANASHGHVETLPESYDITAWIFGMAQTQWLRSSGSYAECFNLRHGTV